MRQIRMILIECLLRMERTDIVSRTDLPSPILERVRRIVFCLLLLLWWALFLRQSPEGLLAEPWIDLLFLLSAGCIALYRGSPLADSLWFGWLARDLFLHTANGLEGFPQGMAISWVLWLAAWAFWAVDEQRRTLLLLFLAGSTFDVASSQSPGMGMAIGWDTALRDLLFLSASLRTLCQTSRTPSSGRANHGSVLVFLAVGFLLLALHRNGSAGHTTCVVLASWASFILFLRTSLPGGISCPGVAEVFVLTGIPLALVVVGMGVAEGGLGGLLGQKRLFAGSIHPNLLAVQAQLSLLLLVGRPLFPGWNSALRPLSLAALIGLNGLLLLGTGARLPLLVLVGCLVVWGLREFMSLQRGRAVAIACGLALLMLVGGWVWKSSSAYEWTTNERLFIWKAAVENIKNAIWTGHGVFAYGMLPQRIPVKAGLWAFDWNYPHVHCLFLEIALTMGVCGLLPLGLIFWRWLTTNAGSRLLIGALLLDGLFDFPLFVPSTASIAALLLFAPGEPGERALVDSTRPHLVIRENWRWPVLVLGLMAIIGLIPQQIGVAAFHAARGALAAGDPLWQQRLRLAIEAQPGNRQLRMQSLLWNLHTGNMRLEEALQVARGLSREDPGWYLPAFLEGRIQLLSGTVREAISALDRSISLEPRDLTGIRWAMLAEARRADGRGWEDAALQAVARGEWGPALVLDHPRFGQESRRVLPERFLQMLTVCPDPNRSLFYGLIARNLASRGVVNWMSASSPLQLESVRRPAQDLWTSIELLGRSIAERVGDENSAGLSTLQVLLAAAAERGDDALSERLLQRLDQIWIKRAKADESLSGLWIEARLRWREKRPGEAVVILEKLLLIDPGNPWILETLGDAFALAGQTERAVEAWKQARRMLPNAALRPFFAEGPREEAFNNTGDQWTFAFELALRRFDPDAKAFSRDLWAAFERRLAEKIEKQDDQSP